MSTTISKKVSFGSLFTKNNDGTFSPRKTLSILGIAGNFEISDKISELKLSDRSYIHDHETSTLDVRMFGPVFVIMKFFSRNLARA